MIVKEFFMSFVLIVLTCCPAFSKDAANTLLNELEYDDVLIGTLLNYTVTDGQYSADFDNEIGDEWQFHGKIDDAFHAYLRQAAETCAKNDSSTVAVLFSMEEPVAIISVSRSQLYIQPDPVLREKYAVIGVCEPETDNCGKLRIAAANPRYKQVTESLPGHEAEIFFTEDNEVVEYYPAED